MSKFGGIKGYNLLFGFAGLLVYYLMVLLLLVKNKIFFFKCLMGYVFLIRA